MISVTEGLVLLHSGLLFRAGVQGSLVHAGVRAGGRLEALLPPTWGSSSADMPSAVAVGRPSATTRLRRAQVVLYRAGRFGSSLRLVCPLRSETRTGSSGRWVDTLVLPRGSEALLAIDAFLRRLMAVLWPRLESGRGFSRGRAEHRCQERSVRLCSLVRRIALLLTPCRYRRSLGGWPGPALRSG